MHPQREMEVSGKYKALDAMLPWSKEYRQYEIDEIEANRHLLDNLFPMPEQPKVSNNNEKSDLQSDTAIA